MIRTHVAHVCRPDAELTADIRGDRGSSLRFRYVTSRSNAFAVTNVKEQSAAELEVQKATFDGLHDNRYRELAAKILDTGGASLSEYPTGEPAQRHYFAIWIRAMLRWPGAS
jgi:hypothetical protein